MGFRLQSLVMKKSLKYREAIRDARRIVVKIGSRVLVQKTGRPEIRRIRALVKQLAALGQKGYEIVVVTSGAVGAGMEALGMRTRPQKLPDQQMAAAVGQCRLMARYDDLFADEHCRVGQVLLTRTDFQDRIRMTNARRTIENLIRHNVIPIINENDVIACEEIQADMAFGDNDLLSALLVKLIRADMLLLLTTVNGLRKQGKATRATRVPYLEGITSATFKLVTDSGNNLSKGGMRSKLRAARIVSKSGAASVIADGRQSQVISRIMQGHDIGTFIVASV
jgi:glutamate 5-kinase